MFLVGDIGGTKTHLAVISPDMDFRQPLVEAEFASAQYPDIESIIKEFLSGMDAVPEIAVFGVAGPVSAGKAKITNLPWVMDEKELSHRLRIPSISLINDLEAIGYAIPSLNTSDLYILNDEDAVKGGNIAIIAPGTGLGEACLLWDGSSYRVQASEGGHADFAPFDSLGDELWHYLHADRDHVSYEMVCSGPGISNIYRFLKERHPAKEPPWLSERLAEDHDPTPIIVDAALDHDHPCEQCSQAVRLFASILGAEAGNVALKFLATGGVYIAGGVSRRTLPFLEKRQFMKSFRHKGRMTDLISRIPVYVIVYPKVALLGVACYTSKTFCRTE